MAQTRRLSDLDEADFDTVFYPGGHGPLWDLTEDAHSVALIEAFYAAGKPVGLVCHAPGVLRDVKGTDGEPLVRGRKVTGFTNSEEEGVGLTQIVTYLVEDMLRSKGGSFVNGPDWAPFTVQDGRLITGQNPASSAQTATRLIAALGAQNAA